MSRRLGLGDTFGMSMHMGIGYSMVSTVIEFEENRRIAWQSRSPGRWAGSSAGGSGGTSSSRSTAAPWSARAGTSARTINGPSSRWASWPSHQVEHGQDPGPHRGADRSCRRPDARWPADRGPGKAGPTRCCPRHGSALRSRSGHGRSVVRRPPMRWPTPPRLAPVVEQLGYRRLWVAEHHGMPSVASSAPAVLIGHLADATTHLRVGAGGVMLPNHSPLVIAEQFATLEALHPGRIDLGLGRAPGTDPFTARALRRTDDLGADTFPDDVVELINYLVDSDGPPTRPAPVPGRGYLPETWLLGSSTFSAQLAGMLGLPFSFAYHFSPGPGRPGPRAVPVGLPPVDPARPAPGHGGGVRPVRPERRRGPVAGRPVGPHHPAAADRPARTRRHPRGGGGLPVHARASRSWSTPPPPPT